MFFVFCKKNHSSLIVKHSPLICHFVSFLPRNHQNTVIFSPKPLNNHLKVKNNHQKPLNNHPKVKNFFQLPQRDH